MHVLYVTINLIFIVFFGMVLPFILIDLPGIPGLRRGREQAIDTHDADLEHADPEPLVLWADAP